MLEESKHTNLPHVHWVGRDDDLLARPRLLARSEGSQFRARTRLRVSYEVTQFLFSRR